MEKYRHQLEELGRVDPALGELQFIETNHDNTAYFSVYQQPESNEQAFVFNGRVVARARPLDCESWALSYDGRRLAVTKARRRRGQPGEIHVNGELAYTVPFDTIYRLVWLDDDHLAWSAWNDEDLHQRQQKIKWRQEMAQSQGVAVSELPPDPELEESGIRFFINGEDRTDQFCFECYGSVNGRSGIRVRLDKLVASIDDTGKIDHFQDTILMDDGGFCFSHHDTQRWYNSEEGRRSLEMARSKERPAPLPPDADTRGMKLSDLTMYGLLEEKDGRVTWRGQAGPRFDGLENRSGLHTYSFSDDGQRLAYIGINYAGWARRLMRSIGPLIEKGCDRESEGKSPWWMWPLALLFNPYMGPGYAASESSRRWFPVDNGRAWEKGYGYANDHFYTPANALVVTCYQGNKVMVVIDEQEGPAFDQVWNVRHLPSRLLTPEETRESGQTLDPDDSGVCYLARQGDKIFRVTIR